MAHLFVILAGIVSAPHVHQGNVAEGVWPPLVSGQGNVVASSALFRAPLTDASKIAPFSNVGPVCAWVGGELVCYADDAPTVGSAMPPGLTGAGQPGRGYAVRASVTQRASYSRQLDTGWGQTGTDVVSCGHAGPFADGTTVCRVTDDSTGASEFISQVFSTASVGDRLQVCLYARADDDAQVVNIIARETSGCTGGAQNYTYTRPISSSWQAVSATHAVVDPTCSNLSLLLQVTTSAPAVGHAYLIAQAYSGIDYCPPIYCETEAANVTCGADYLTADWSGLADASRISLSYTPAVATLGVDRYLLDSRTGTDGVALRIDASTGALSLVTGDADAASTTTSSALTWAPGTTYRIEAHWADGNAYVYRDGVLVASTEDGSAAMPSSHSATTAIGATGANDSHAAGWLADLVVRR